MTKYPPPQEQTSLFGGYIIPPYCSDEVHEKAVKVVGSFSASVSRTVDHDTKEEAVERGLKNADPLWKSGALDTILEIAQKNPTFTSDDVLNALEAFGFQTRDTRALGGILLTAARLKWIRKSGNYRPSIRPACHSRPILIWESLLFTP